MPETPEKRSDSRPIGVFDSGLGGLTTVRQLLRRLPHENIVYFGDTGRVPYGTRGEEVIRRYAAQDCALLMQHDVKIIIAACGTVSSVAPGVLRDLPVPTISVVNPASRVAASVTKNGIIGVLGTAATVKSGSYAKAVKAARPDVKIHAIACPMFVPLVENGWNGQKDDIARLAVERYLQPLKRAGADTVILGCTHFPLLAPVIQDFLGDTVILVDAGEEAARVCQVQLAEAGMLNREDKGNGDVEYYVSDQPSGFSALAERFLGVPVKKNVHVVDPGLL